MDVYCEEALGRPDNVKSILEFIDQHKYDPNGLWDSLSGSSPEAIRVKTVLEDEMRNFSHWPAEFRSWQAGVLGLLASQIATIASPFLRRDAAQELFALAERFGFSRTQIGMLCGEMAGLEEFASRTSLVPSRN